MIGKRSAVFGGLSVLVVMGIIASLVFTFAANPNQEPPGVLSADEAEVKGLELARFAGLVGIRPTWCLSSPIWKITPWFRRGVPVNWVPMPAALVGTRIGRSG